jgi:hypothetical protein
MFLHLFYNIKNKMESDIPVKIKLLLNIRFFLQILIFDNSITLDIEYVEFGDLIIVFYVV